jgi:hypothetical protein
MNVNKDVFENKWEQIRAQTRGWWSLFTEEDLNKVEKAPVKIDKAPIKRDKYAMMLRVKYGYTQQRASDEINQRLIDLEANPPSSESMRDSLDRKNSSLAPKVRKSRIRKSSL